MRCNYFLIVSISWLMFSCDSDEMSPSEKTLNLATFNALAIDGNAVIKVDPDHPANGQVRITGGSELIASSDLSVVNDVLVIRTYDDVQLTDSLTIIINPSNLTHITLQADQRAVVSWEGDHDHLLTNIDIKTEANSILGIFNIHASNINLQQEAQSKVQLESWHWLETDTLAVLKTTAILIDTNSYVVGNDYIINFDAVREVEKDGQIYLVFDGPRIQKFFIVPNVTAKLEATSELNAGEMPVHDLDIRLEGESKATVWVINKIIGKGEGESTLLYKGSPKIEFVTNGSAEIEKL